MLPRPHHPGSLALRNTGCVCMWGRIPDVPSSPVSPGRGPDHELLLAVRVQQQADLQEASLGAQRHTQQNDLTPDEVRCAGCVSSSAFARHILSGSFAGS